MVKRKDRKSVQSLTDVEWIIMNVVWEHEPCAAGAVQEALAESHGWAYSTVKTTMDRMVAKDVLATESIRNLTLYKSLISRDDAQRSEIQQCLRRAFQGALAPMLQFMVAEQELKPADIEELRRMIKPDRKKKPE